MSAPSFPYWATQPQLPSKATGYSFSSNPLLLVYGETEDRPVTVSFLNGSLPPGTRWQNSTQGIQILGEVASVTQDTDFEFTFRLNNGTRFSDQTFFITITGSVSKLFWKTNSQNPLLYYYTAGPVSATLVAQSIPSKLISYSLQSAPPTGVSFNSLGVVKIDLSWLPNQQYNVDDFVFSNKTLYQCIVSGLSDPEKNPTEIGPNVVDSFLNRWQPQTQYRQNDFVVSDLGQVYRCLEDGVSGTLPPVETDSPISDGSTSWEFRYQAAVWLTVPQGLILPLRLTVQAQAGSQTIEQDFYISVVSTPAAPIWLTPPGELASLPGGEWFTFNLQVLEVNQQLLTFSQTPAVSWPSWLHLSVDGELWGQLPNETSDQIVTFSVTAEDPVGAVSQEFSITVKQNIATLEWTTQSDLGSVPDGTNCWLQVQAQTLTRGAYITYQLTGGMIPPNTVVFEQSGNITGFVDYHSQMRNYYFEVSATEQQPQIDIDGNFVGYIQGQTVTKQFALSVVPSHKGKFVSISVPIFGQTKLDFLRENNNSLADEPVLFVPNDPRWGRNQNPEIVLVDGLAWSDPSNVVSLMRNWMHDFRLVASHINVSNLSHLPYQTLFLQFKDNNSLPLWQPHTYYEVNTRICNGEGTQFVATQGGTSGNWPEPSSFLDEQSDNTVIWQRESGQNTKVGVNIPLPWYPHHQYFGIETAQSTGNILRNVKPGISSGLTGPDLTNLAVDGSTSWQNNTNTLGTNTYWPASVKNIRDQLIQTFGLASAVGKNAQASVKVDSTTGSILSVNVTNAGNGYYKSPALQVVGQGKGAKLTATVGINSGIVTKSGTGFANGQQFSVTQGQGSPAVIQITQVNNLGKVQSIAVFDSGSYTVFPSKEVAFSTNGQEFFVQFDLGVKEISVSSAGTGYKFDTTSVDFGGIEYLPQWQKDYVQGYLPSVDLAWLKNPNSLVPQTIDNPFEGQRFEIKQLKMQIQGLEWQGTTRWDTLDCMFDGGATQFIETDSLVTSFDSSTQFDRNTEFDSISKDILRYDPNSTVDMMYDDIFTHRSTIPQSVTSHIWLLQFGAPFE